MFVCANLLVMCIFIKFYPPWSSEVFLYYYIINIYVLITVYFLIHDGLNFGDNISMRL